MYTVFCHLCSSGEPDTHTIISHSLSLPHLSLSLSLSQYDSKCVEYDQLLSEHSVLIEKDTVISAQVDK